MPRNDCWGTPVNDVFNGTLVPEETGWELELEESKAFRAFAESDGEEYATPYDNIINRLNIKRKKRRTTRDTGKPVKPSRAETYKRLFDCLGLLSVREARVHLTQFGRFVRENRKQAGRYIMRANDAVAERAVKVLGKYQLANPSTANRSYPEDCDIFPYRAIWLATLRLDNRLHHEELNRIILKVMRQSDLDDAIEKIKAARDASYNPNDEKSASSSLGPRAIEKGEETTRRMTPWFSLAGFGGLLMNREADSAGFRSIHGRYKPLIETELQTQPSFQDFDDDEEAWFKYLGQIEPSRAATTIMPSDDGMLKKLKDCCDRFGSSRFILLSGVAGTGKTRMAGILADVLTEGDDERRFETQFHESFSYDDFVEGMKPTREGGFQVVKRIFRKANDRAKEVARTNPGAKVVLLVEEFSRANLANVLGEIFTYVEHRNRRFTYLLSEEEDSVSENLIIIGTMNPLDRSVVEMDDALVRRTRIFEMGFSEAALRDMLSANGLDAGVIDRLADALRPVAKELPFGHGAFADVRREEDLYDLWDEQLKQYFIKPGVEEHLLYPKFKRHFSTWIEQAGGPPAQAATADNPRTSDAEGAVS